MDLRQISTLSDLVVKTIKPPSLARTVNGQQPCHRLSGLIDSGILSGGHFQRAWDHLGTIAGKNGLLSLPAHSAGFVKEMDGNFQLFDGKLQHQLTQLLDATRCAQVTDAMTELPANFEVRRAWDAANACPIVLKGPALFTTTVPTRCRLPGTDGKRINPTVYRQIMSEHLGAPSKIVEHMVGKKIWTTTGQPYKAYGPDGPSPAFQVQKPMVVPRASQATVDSYGHSLAAAVGAGVPQSYTNQWHNPLTTVITKLNNHFSSSTFSQGPLGLFGNVPRVISNGAPDPKTKPWNSTRFTAPKVYVPDIISHGGGTIRTFDIKTRTNCASNFSRLGDHPGASMQRPYYPLGGPSDSTSVGTWQTEQDYQSLRLYHKRMDAFDIQHRHKDTHLFRKRLDELHLSIISVGPNGSFSKIMPDLVKGWSVDYAKRKTNYEDDVSPAIFGKYKAKCRDECYTALHYMTMAGLAAHVFQRAEVLVGTTGDDVKRRFETKNKKTTKVSNGSAAAAASADDAEDENGNGVFPSVSDPENSSQFSSGSVSVLVEDSENEMDEDVGGPAVDFSSSVPVTSSVGYSPCTSSS